MHCKLILQRFFLTGAMAAIKAFDEILGAGGREQPRPEFAELARWIETMPPGDFERRQQAAEQYFRDLGITFAVYGEENAAERIIPFDIVPRIFTAGEWERLSAALIQRVEALNAFVADIYGPRRILDDGVIPPDLIFRNPQFCVPANSVRPPAGIHTHICGIDLVRTGPDDFWVLEDNCRTPSGVSYMIENREAMIRLCPELFRTYDVAPVDSYTDCLRDTLKSVAPDCAQRDPVCVLLTPGHFNSAFYEHSFLADCMGIALVEGSDLEVDDDIVYMRTIAGRRRVDVIYRRVDDDFLDPLVFNAASMLGVPGLIAAWRSGNVTIVNAPGTGIADDKAIYSYIPAIVEFYTGKPPVLPNVETFNCRNPDELKYVLERLPELVVKEVHGSGGYGMLVGPKSTKEEIETFRAKLKANPSNYIAQPTLGLSTCPTLSGGIVGPRHLDLRPFVLVGDRVRLVPGGLTRVAMKQGSLVVNSSQGGGTKDTWVLQD